MEQLLGNAGQDLLTSLLPLSIRILRIVVEITLRKAFIFHHC